MSLTAALLDAALGAAADRLLGGALERVAKRFKQAKERRELAAICAEAVDAAAHDAPSLGPDLRSASFCEGALVPIVIDLIANPLQIPKVEQLADRFIAMFVASFARDHDVDAVLERIFQSDRATLDRAMIALFTAIRAGLARSAHWRDIVDLQQGHEALSGVEEILAILRTDTGRVDIDTAREDAWQGSERLRDWPRDIYGEQIDRPEYGQLLERIKEHPRGTTLLVGEAGSGKSALMASLIDGLRAAGRNLFAIKADMLPAEVRTLDDIGTALGMKGPLRAELHALAQEGPLVLLIDQLDAVSHVMDHRAERMRLLLGLAADLQSDAGDGPAVHVLVTSRPFEADHDARFQRLAATRISLALPSRAQVDDLLRSLEIDPDAIPTMLAETIRRPFALKLLVDLIRRGHVIDDLLPGQLLQTWLDSLTVAPDDRRALVALMTTLAAEMVHTETLWRPADRHRLTAGPALSRAIAAGLIVDDGAGRIGFSHQSWLDDFQARDFVTGGDLARFAWERQDSLFPRAAVLRGLQRLRQYDPEAYHQAIDLLLGEPRTRRHIRHLVIDLLGLTITPTDREVAWVRRLLDSDLALGRRALANIYRRWDGWRTAARPWLADLAANSDFDWQVRGLLEAESAHDVETVANILDGPWSDAGHDWPAALMLEAAKAWDVRFAARLMRATERGSLDGRIAHLAGILHDAGRSAFAAELIITAIARAGANSAAINLYDVDKIAEAEALTMADGLLRWFVTLAESDIGAPRSQRAAFAASAALPWDWKHSDGGESSAFTLLRTALATAAQTDPAALATILTPTFGVEIEQVQAVIADSLAAAGPALAELSLAFLCDDPRRLGVGDAHGSTEDGVIRTVPAWSARRLITAIAPGLSSEQATALRDVVLAWNCYADIWPELSAADKRLYQGWVEEARFACLAALPPAVLGPRLARRVAEWQRDQPVFSGTMNSVGMARIVGSPMSDSAMAQASDADLRRMLDIVDDRVDGWPERRGKRRYDGGVHQLARAFGAFAKAEPERALALIETMVPGKHEQVAGDGLRELGAIADPHRLIDLITRLDAQGFASPDWRNDCAWALAAASGRRKGLDTATLAMVEGWIERDSAGIADQIERRQQLEEKNREANRDKVPKSVEPQLFVRRGGIVVMPQKNFTFLDTMAQGWLDRIPADHEALMAAMERHLADREDPTIWAFFLRRFGRVLFWVDRARAEAFWERMLAEHGEAFDDPIAAGMVWDIHETMPMAIRVTIIARWLAGPAPLPQLAGEMVGAMMLRDEEPAIGALATVILDQAGEARTGLLLSAAAIWREGRGAIRERAHRLILGQLDTESGDEAQALATMIAGRGPLADDPLTQAMLPAIAARPVVLRDAFTMFAVQSLQRLLLSPGFDEIVLDYCERALEAALARSEGRGAAIDSDLVEIAVALQRSDGPLRARAMDFYERLLDANVYGAEAAAEAALRR